MDVAQLPRYALHLRVQERRFERITEPLENGKAVRCVLALFFAFTYFSKFPYSRKKSSTNSTKSTPGVTLAHRV